ncbi:MAG TPA: HAMP domain-containing sensor histidine kinase [Longimicrobiales bacterium]|nr:HAMP domain-containing sensor histidine kinase [Longimicrobiales bacterium]
MNDSDERLADLARAAARGLCDYALVDLQERGDRRRAVACSGRGDPALVAALRTWTPARADGVGGALARALDDAARRGAARLLRQLHPDWLRTELQAGEHQIGLLDTRPPRSALVLPIVSERGAGGVLALFSLDDDAFDPDAIEAGASLARLAGGALERDAFEAAAALAERAREDFLSVVSHELRSPLTTIIGYADLLKTDAAGQLSEIQRERVDRIAASAWELVRDLERIMELVRAQSPETEPRPDAIELAAFTTSVARIAEPIATEKGLEFRIARPESRVEMVTDPDKLRRALLNLLHNAVRYTRSGWVALESSADSATVRFIVRDTGIGMGHEARRRAFEPFSRAGHSHGPGSGIGLGLSLSRHLVRQLQGDIRLDSEPGRGTIVTIELPRRLSPMRRELPELPLLAAS